MIRAIVYSLIAVIIFVAVSMLWLLSGEASDVELMFGWTVIISLFAVAPIFFAIGLMHHYRRNPTAPRWDRERGE